MAKPIRVSGYHFHQLGDHSAALSQYETALQIQEEVDAQHDVAVTLNNMAGIYEELTQFQQAETAYQRSIALRQKIADGYGEGLTRYNLALLYQAQGRLEAAIHELQQVVELDEQLARLDLAAKDRAMLTQIQTELRARN
ncbi:MAG: tetratricopeptide repeat protein [Anaerolineales bacterium]|nr:tetratricopeptide repeat protein [Anaerolineales bacterium]